MEEMLFRTFVFASVLNDAQSLLFFRETLRFLLSVLMSFFFAVLGRHK